MMRMKDEKKEEEEEKEEKKIERYKFDGEEGEKRVMQFNKVTI